MPTKYLFRQVRVVCPASIFHLKTTDILVENGIILQIETDIKPADAHVISSPNLHISGGWLDTSANFFEPGFEQKETLETGTKAAIQGGFTAVALHPANLHITQTKAQISYYKTHKSAVNLLPMAALTQNLAGENLTEMMDLHQAGAVAFSNAQKPMHNAGTMLRTLQYAQHFDGLIYSQPNDPQLSAMAMVNESLTTNALGLRGAPNIAESIAIARDIELLRYTGGRLHFDKISTIQGVELIQKAKNEGLNVTASTTAHHLMLTDKSLQNFDTNYKVQPPLRTKTDQNALLNAIKNGVIDCVCSDHTPHEKDAKFCEFELADYGMIGLETVFSVLNSLNVLDISTIVNLLCAQPRHILKQAQPTFEVGAAANFTLFDPKLNYTFSEQHIGSKSKNTPFLGHEFTGKVIGIYNNATLAICL